VRIRSKQINKNQPLARYSAFVRYFRGNENLWFS